MREILKRNQNLKLGNSENLDKYGLHSPFPPTDFKIASPSAGP